MKTIFFIALVATLPCATLGFRAALYRNQVPQCGRVQCSTTTNLADETHHEDSLLERMMAFLFNALPEVLAPTPTKVDENKIRKNPPKWVKEHSVSGFRKKHKGESYWAQQEIVDRWTEKYLPELKKGDIKVAIVGEDILITYPEALNEPMGEYELNPIAAAERFVAEAVEQAVSPLDKPMNEDKVFAQPRRWSKPVNLSKLKKTLDKDPDYFRK